MADDYQTWKEMQEQRAEACPDCGAPNGADHCEWCDRFDAILADAPRAGNLAEFYEAFGEVLHS